MNVSIQPSPQGVGISTEEGQKDWESQREAADGRRTNTLVTRTAAQVQMKQNLSTGEGNGHGLPLLTKKLFAINT